MRDLKYYLNYINFEEDLLKLIRIRRDKHKIAEKKGSIDYRIIKKIKELYLDAIRCAPDNYDVCVKYYLFCTRNAQPATEAVERLLRVSVVNKSYQLIRLPSQCARNYVTLRLCICHCDSF